MGHLSQTEIEAVVMETAPADERTRRHLRECAACAARLAREATFEETLHDSLPMPHGFAISAPRSRGWLVAWSAAAAVAVVALGVWIGGSPSRGTPATPRPAVAEAPVASAPPDETPGMPDPLSLAPRASVR